MKHANKTPQGDASHKGMMAGRNNGANSAMQASRMETDARSRLAMETQKGEAHAGGFGRTVGAATKDNRHGIHTDHGTSRRSESRRDGSMGRESKSKSNRKNI